MPRLIIVVIIFLISQLDTLKCRKVKRFSEGHSGNQWRSDSRPGERRQSSILWLLKVEGGGSSVY